MARATPYIFARFKVGFEEDDWDGARLFKALRKVKGQRFDQPYSRSTVPDTLAMAPASRTIGGFQVLHWMVGHKVMVRTAIDYDDLNHVLKVNTFPGEGVRYEDFIAIPALGVMAISDRTGEQHIGAKNAAARLQTVVRKGFPGAEIILDLGVSEDDVEAALKQWTVREFSFTVRPFNPTVRRQGQKVHEALVDEKGAVFRGVIKAQPGEGLEAKEGGFINEAIGLSRAGYGQIGFTGETPEGQVAQFKKPEFSQDKNKNQKVRDKGQPLKVFIEPQPSAKKDIEEIAKALISFYDRPASKN